MSHDVRDSHAGGIVVRESGTRPEYLIVRARRDPSAWVLPKGHIEPGESPEAAAVREVEEEAGCHATIVAPLGRLVFGDVRTRIYLMRFERDVPRRESRERRWGPYDAVRDLLTFEDTRELLAQAHEFVTRGHGNH